MKRAVMHSLPRHIHLANSELSYEHQSSSSSKINAHFHRRRRAGLRSNSRGAPLLL